MTRSDILKKDYWSAALKNCADIKMIAVAAIFTALSIGVKAFDIPIIPNVLIISFACYFHALGALIYGPFLALFSGAVSDTLGAILFPQGAYFFPYIFPEMLSCFIYALFFWKKENISVSRVLTARFTVNILCNIILNSVIMKWQYILYGGEKYVPLLTMTRVVKNLVIFPLEGAVMAMIITAAVPAMKSLRIIPKNTKTGKLNADGIILLIDLFILSAGLVAYYVFGLRDFLMNYNWSFI